MAAPCWLLEEFVVTTECSQCNAFQTVSVKQQTEPEPELDSGCHDDSSDEIVYCVSEVVVVLRSDRIRGESQLHEIQQRRVQEVRHSDPPNICPLPQHL